MPQLLCSFGHFTPRYLDDLRERIILLQNNFANGMSTEEGDTQEASVTPGPDEVFCTSCGVTIKEEAEVCPECGVRQKEDDQTQSSGSSDLPDARKHELQKIAKKDQTTVAVVSVLLTPVGYLMIGKTGLAIINFLTLNYFLLGFIIVPIHTWKIIENARDELQRHGESW